MTTRSTQAISLTFPEGPSVLGVERVSIGTAVVRVTELLPAGRWVHVSLEHPAFGALTTAGHVAWSQQIAPGLPLALVGIEFVGTWEKLGALRRAVLGVVASDALVGDAPVGWVAAEPDGTWTCFTRDSMKVAMLSQDGKGVSVRRRDPVDPAGVLLPATSFQEALVLAFDRAPSEAVRLEPSIGPSSAGHLRPAAMAPAAPGRPASRPPGRPPSSTPAKPAPVAISESAEDVILAAQTILVHDSAEDADEEQILAARTLRMDDRPPPPARESEDDLLAANTVVLPKERVAPKGEPGPDRRWSKVQDGATLVGWIARDTDTAWTIYDEKRRKIAVASVEEGRVRVCWLGDKSTESFEYFEAPTVGEAMAAAFELAAPPRIDPPL